MGYSFPVNVSTSALNIPASGGNVPVNSSVKFNRHKKSRWNVTLTSLTIWYTIPNISATKGDNQIAYYNGSTTKLVTFPDGGYTVQQIATYFTSQVQANGDDPTQLVFAPFLTTGTQLTIGSGGYYIDFSSAYPASKALGAVLGFNSGIYSTQGTTISQNQANTTNGFSSFLFQVDNIFNTSFSLAPSSQKNGLLTASAVMYQNSFSVCFGSIQTFDLFIPIPLPVNIETLKDLNFKITDQNNNLIDFGQNGNYQNNPASFTLLFEEISDIAENDPFNAVY